ncbi:MAG: N-acetyl-alpha-D-glucosaminyl L-malate synthase BshA, partial [Bacteroidia bacterium]|nr:N-acetyl-alpha-D-glucosaminyl L-malate synthase BshA [Bacteroidia bacterium]
QQPVRLSGFKANVFYHEVRVPTYPLFDFPPYETALASTMVDVISNNDIQLLHVHYAIPHASAAYMAKQILAKEGKRIPVITTLHGTDITLVGKDASFEPVVRYSINQSDGVTSVSESLKQDTYNIFKTNRAIEVIPNFIDVQRFSKQDREHFKKAIAPNGERLIIHTSNFRKVKRIDDVVKVFAEILKNMPAKLLLVGDGPERIYIENLCRELNLNDSVTFLGKQNPVEEILSVCDLFLMPSETESFGLAALEAMACELPVISSNAGGIPELNIDGVTGFLCNVGDVKTMAEKAIYILSDQERLLKFKQAARARAHEFDINNIVPVYEQYYEKILSAYARK